MQFHVEPQGWTETILLCVGAYMVVRVTFIPDRMEKAGCWDTVST